MKGIWMWNQNVQERGAEKTVDSCARAGITDLWFLTKGLSGASAHHGVYSPHVCQRDLLAEVIEAAHRRDIRVHAWFTSTCDENYKRLHPESGRGHYRRGKDRELISLTDEGYLAYMEKIVREVCRNYDVDGLHLDYIRYNHLLYGWSEEDLVRYASAGADPKYLRSLIERMFYGDSKEENLFFDLYRAEDESVHAFARVRRNDVVRVASHLTEAARSEKAGLILSAALMPEGAYEDTAFSDLHYGQNYEDAAKLYELALPMAYSKAYGQDAQWVRRIAEGTLSRGMKTLVGLHAYEGGTGPSLKADIHALADTHAEGYCLFREGACAMAYADGKSIDFYNALAEEITGAEITAHGESVRLNEIILPGEEKRFTLPFAPETIRVFAKSGERSVYLTQS